MGKHNNQAHVVFQGG